MADRAQAATVGIIFVGLAIIAVGGLYVYMESYESVASDTETFVNETQTDTTGLVGLDNSNKSEVIYYEASNITVYNGSDVEMSRPDDYEWNRLNGTLTVNATGDLDGDSQLNATYGYNIGSEQAQAVLQVSDAQRTVLRVLVFVVAVGAVVSGLRVFTQ